jgi:hypothetical protein
VGNPQRQLWGKLENYVTGESFQLHLIHPASHHDWTYDYTTWCPTWCQHLFSASAHDHRGVFFNSWIKTISRLRFKMLFGVSCELVWGDASSRNTPVSGRLLAIRMHECRFSRSRMDFYPTNSSLWWSANHQE